MADQAGSQNEGSTVTISFVFVSNPAPSGFKWTLVTEEEGAEGGEESGEEEANEEEEEETPAETRQEGR